MELNKKRRLNNFNEVEINDEIDNNNEIYKQDEKRNYHIKKSDNQFIVNNIMIGEKSLVDYLVEFKVK